MRRNVIVGVAVVFIVSLAPVSGASPTTYSYETIDYPGAGVTQARGVNNQGQIVGSYGSGQEAIHADPGAERLHGFFLDRNGFHNVDVSDTVGTHPEAITESGEIAGFIGDYDQRCCAHTHISGYLQDGDDVELIEIRGLNVFVQDVNDRGHVIGFSHDSAGRGPGFIWDAGEITEVAPDGAISTYLVATGEPEVVVGGSSPGGGFTYRRGTFTPLTFPSGMHDVGVRGTNNQGDMVGAYTDDSGRRSGFLLRGGQVIDINVPGADGTLPFDVSDNRKIVGEYYLDGVTHAFVATPMR
jgi:hypothetical protein